jgi:starvation-inducible outer membrane lipoprotein
MNLSFKTIWAMAVVLLLVGCASHPKRVNCDGQMKPINAPAPTAKSAHP